MTPSSVEEAAGIPGGGGGGGGGYYGNQTNDTVYNLNRSIANQRNQKLTQPLGSS